MVGIGKAIEHIKEKPMQNYAYRKGWNGKDMYIFFQKGSTFKKEPNAYTHKKILMDEFMDEVKYLDRLCLVTHQKDVNIGWLASQTDLLAEDWIIGKVVEVESDKGIKYIDKKDL